jgi:hypothetical protein
MAFAKKRGGSEKRRQCRKMSFRVDDAEKAAIEAAAARQGLTPGSYIRSRALAKPTIFPDFLDMILRDYKVLGERIHVAGASNGGVSAFHVASLYAKYF